MIDKAPFSVYTGTWNGWAYSIIDSVSAGLQIYWHEEWTNHPPEDAQKLFRGGVELWLINKKYANLDLEEFLAKTIIYE